MSLSAYPGVEPPREKDITVKLSYFLNAVTKAPRNSPVFRPRHQRKQHRKLFAKIHFEFYRFFICFSLLLCTTATIFLTWGAIQLEEFANRNYELQPKDRTQSTCHFTISGPEDISCDRLIPNETHRMISYYGIRLDCILGSPLILISLWFFWKNAYGVVLLLVAHLFAWTKSICLVAALTCVLIDDPSHLRVIFEKAHFGSYESKLLYSYTMVGTGMVLNLCVIGLLFYIPCIPDRYIKTYGVETPKNTKKNKKLTTSVAVVERFEDIEDNELPGNPFYKRSIFI